MRRVLCTTDSPSRLAAIALRIGAQALERYSSPYSRRDFTQAQLFALLVLRVFFRTDYRGIIGIVADSTHLRRVLGLSRVPHYSTLCYAQRRLGAAHFACLFDRLVAFAKQRGLIGSDPWAAVDATGFETGHASHYFVERSGCRRYLSSSYPKLGAVCDVRSHLVVSAVTCTGPSQDSPLFIPLMREAAKRLRFRRALADKGFDAEHNHVLCRERLGIPHTVIPPRRRTRPKGSRRWPETKYRRQMKRRFWRRCYGQRWQIESVFSRIKRKLGSQLRSRSPSTQYTECLLRTVTFDLMLL